MSETQTETIDETKVRDTIDEYCSRLDDEAGRQILEQMRSFAIEPDETLDGLTGFIEETSTNVYNPHEFDVEGEVVSVLAAMMIRHALKDHILTLDVAEEDRTIDAAYRGHIGSLTSVFLSQPLNLPQRETLEEQIERYANKDDLARSFKQGEEIKAEIESGDVEAHALKDPELADDRELFLDDLQSTITIILDSYKEPLFDEPPAIRESVNTFLDQHEERLRQAADELTE